MPTVAAGDVCMLLLSRVSLTPWLRSWLLIAVGLGALPSSAFFTISEITSSLSAMALRPSWRQSQAECEVQCLRTGWHS